MNVDVCVETITDAGSTPAASIYNVVGEGALSCWRSRQGTPWKLGGFGMRKPKVLYLVPASIPEHNVVLTGRSLTSDQRCGESRGEASAWGSTKNSCSWS